MIDDAVLWVLLGMFVMWVVSLIAVLAVEIEFYHRVTQQLGEIKELMPNCGPPQPKWAEQMENRILQKVETLMALVSVEQTDLDTFAATVETEVTAIGTAVGVVTGYIQTLLAGQATPLPAADESAITQAVADLTASVGTLSGLEPPAPTPTP